VFVKVDRAKLERLLRLPKRFSAPAFRVDAAFPNPRIFLFGKPAFLRFLQRGKA
jgi:hypothetical protein